MLSTTERMKASTLLSAIERAVADPPNMEISDLIRAKRKERGLSQRALADLLQVNNSAVAQWELGTTLPTNANMTALRALLGIGEAVQVSPDAPYPGKLVDDPDKLAWLAFWDSMSDERRRTVTELLHIGLPSRKAE